MKFGERVRMRRKELGMTQDDLAMRCGYTARATICLIEKGDRDLPRSKVETLAKALQVTPAWLLGLDSVTKTEELIELVKMLDEADVDTVKTVAESLLSKDKYKKGFSTSEAI